MTPTEQALVPCKRCGNTFIEQYGQKKRWWIGCKVCEKRGYGATHVCERSMKEAIQVWNAKNAEQSSTPDYEKALALARELAGWRGDAIKALDPNDESVVLAKALLYANADRKELEELYSLLNDSHDEWQRQAKEAKNEANSLGSHLSELTEDHKRLRAERAALVETMQEAVCLTDIDDIKRLLNVQITAINKEKA